MSKESPRTTSACPAWLSISNPPGPVSHRCEQQLLPTQVDAEQHLVKTIRIAGQYNERSWSKQ